MSTGNVGIGTSSPNAYSGQTALTINSTGVARLDLDISDSMQGFLLAESGYVGLFANTSKELRLGSNAQTRMVITSTGNVGIGTTSPDLKLDVSHGTGSEYVATFQNTSDNLELKIGTTTGGFLNIQGVTVSANTAYNIALQADGGNVGIGTNNPTSGYKLDVAGAVKATNYEGDGFFSDASYIIYNKGYSGSGAWFSNIYFTNGVANQYVDIICNRSSFWTSGRLILSGTYSHQNQAGRKEYIWTRSNNGASAYGTSLVNIGPSGITVGTSAFEVEGWSWDATNNRHFMRIKKSNTAGNSLGIQLTMDRAAIDLIPLIYLSGLGTY
jgi:hypothetical protein